MLWSASASTRFVFLDGEASFLPTLPIVCTGAMLRLFAIHRIAKSRVRDFGIPFEYDGFGVFARSRTEWRESMRIERTRMLGFAGLAVCLVLWIRLTGTD